MRSVTAKPELIRPLALPLQMVIRELFVVPTVTVNRPALMLLAGLPGSVAA